MGNDQDDPDTSPEESSVPFEGDFFGPAAEYHDDDLPFGDDDPTIGTQWMQSQVDESSDEEEADDEAVGLDTVEPREEIERDGHRLPTSPVSPSQPADATRSDETETPTSGHRAAPGGLRFDAHEQIQHAPAYTVPFGGEAGKPVPKDPRSESALPPRSTYRSYTEKVDPRSSNPYAPFASHIDWEIARWAKLRGSGSTAFSDLLAIPEVRERLGLSFKNSEELNKIIDDQIPNRRPSFERLEVFVAGERFEMFARNILECIEALYCDPEHSPYLCITPERQYADADHTIRLYHDVHTGRWWWATQREVERRKPGATIIPVIISSDKTQLTQFRNKTAYPVYLTIGNLPKEIRRKPSHRGQILLAYLPTTRLRHITNKAARRRTVANLFHACMSSIVAPLEDAGEHGVEMASGDGVVRRCHPILAMYAGDYPEQVLVTATYTGDCPICECPHDELGTYPCPAAPRNIEAVRGALSLFGTAEYSGACEDVGIKPIQHPFWERLPFLDIFQSITPDVLHQLYQGIIKHLLSWIADIVGPDEVDARVQRLPPSHGIRIFHNGITGLSRVTGTEHKQIARFILGLVIDVPISVSDSLDLVGASKALLDFLYIAQYPVHSTTTLDALINALAEFHNKKEVFVRLGARAHFLIPKLHMLTHYMRAIEYYGTTDNYNTEATERLHIDFAKDAYRATNHKDEFPQMTMWLERREKVLQHSNYVNWRLLRAQQSSGDALRATHDFEAVRWRPPDMACTLHHVMTKYPSRKAVPIQEIISPGGYGATHLMPALARFMVELNNPALSRNEVETRATYVRFPFTNLPVFHKIKFRNTLYHGKETLDSIHARPRQPGHRSDIIIPARFDPALVRVRQEDSDPTGRQNDLSNMRVGRVHVVFSLPKNAAAQMLPSSAAIQYPQHLAYVEWMSIFAPAPDPRVQMYKLTTLTGSANIGSVVPITLLARSVHLIPKWGGPVPSNWTSENVLDECRTFYLSQYKDPHSYYNLY